MLFIVAITHDLQRPDSEHRELFQAKLRTIVRECTINAIAEEWSIDAKGAGENGTSTVSELAIEMSRPYMAVDPDGYLRERLGIATSPRGQGAMDFIKMDAWISYVDGCYLREDLWIERLRELIAAHGNVLFVMGESHSLTLPVKLRSEGIPFSIKAVNFIGYQRC